MRRSASEIIRNLEMRIANLEKKASTSRKSSDLFDVMVDDNGYTEVYAQFLSKREAQADVRDIKRQGGDAWIVPSKANQPNNPYHYPESQSSNRKTASSTLKLDSKTLLTVENAIAEKFQYEEEYNGIEVGDVNCFNRVELTSNRGQSLIVVNCELHYTDDEGEEHSEDQSWSIELEEDISNVVGPRTNPYFIFELIRDAVRNIDNLSQD